MPEMLHSWNSWYFSIFGQRYFLILGLLSLQIHEFKKRPLVIYSKVTNDSLRKTQFSSVAQSCSTLCDPMNCSTPSLPVHHQLLGFTQTHVHWVGMPSSYLILCHPLLLLPSIFPSIRVFSNESAVCIRWPKYWSFSFNILPMNI